MIIFSIDIGGTAIKYGTIEHNLPVVNLGNIDTEAQLGSEALFDKICLLIDQARKISNIEAIAVSTAGQVNPFTGSIRHATDALPGWTGFELKDRLERYTKLPVEVTNDVNAACIAEYHYGAGKGKEYVICLTFGTGIGGAAVQNGQLILGKNGSACEFGHMVTHKDGLPCLCGQRGCYEGYASATALVKQSNAYAGYDRYPDGKSLMDAFSMKEPVALKIVEKWAEEVACGISSLVHIFDPCCIILGGGVMANQDAVLLIRKIALAGVMPSYRDVEILPAALGNMAGLIGAAHTFMGRSNDEQKT